MLTLREKIMLALFEKKECARKELAVLCRVAPSQVSRIIKKMIKDGNVEKNRRYVIGSGRFNDFYSLTAEGIFNAKELKEKIGNTKIRVKDKGKLREKRINEINMNILDVVTHVSNNVFEPEKLREKFVLSENIPKFRYFFGREKEINEIKDFLRSESKMLVINGVAGIGKTTLGAKFASEHSGNIFWYKFNEWTTLHDAVRNLGNFLKKIGKNTLNSYVNSDKELGISEVSIILEKDMNNVLVFFDDCHHAKGEVVLFFKSLLSILDKKNDVKIIMLGRSIPLFYDRRDVVLKKRVREIGIGGLDENSGKKLLEHRKIDDGSIDDILKNLKGHPLFLELASGNTKGEIDRYLSEEIFAKLGENEKNALGLASIFRYPFHFNVFSESGIDYSVVEGLVEKSLLKPDFFVHDLIGDFVYPRLTKEQKTKYHGMAGSYYESNEDWIECMHHLAIANPDRAAKISAEKGKQLIRNGHVDDFLSILNKLEGHGQQNELLLLKGDILDIKGEWDKALECYQNIKANDSGLAESYLKMGEIYRKRNEWENALTYYDRSLSIFKKLNNLSGCANVYYPMGALYAARGDNDKAVEFYEKCNKNVRINNPISAKTSLGLGIVYDYKGEKEEAIKHLKNSAKVCEKIGDLQTLTKVYNSLSVVYIEKDDLKRAKEYCEKRIEISNDIGDVRGVGYGLLNICRVYTKTGELEKAEECLRKGLEIFERLREKDMIAAAYMHYGIIYKIEREWEKSSKYFDESIKISHRIGIPYYIGEKHYEYGKMYKSKGDNINARKQFENALKYYEKLGNKEKIKEVKNELLELEKGLRKCQKTRIKRKALKN